jgi:hypothetical protein
MDTIYAQVLAQEVLNIIVIDDPTQLPTFQQGYDALINITGLLDVNSDPIQVGSFYDSVSTNFFPPATLALIQNNVVTNIINNCDAYITNNASQYQAIIDITNTVPQPLVNYVWNGSTFAPPQSFYLFGWGSVYNNIGVDGETTLSIPTGQNLVFVQRLTLNSNFGTLTINGRLIGMPLINNGSG